MALIGKIREKSWLLVLIIGLALLAFILSDYKSIMGGSDDFLGYGTIDGEPVKNTLYEKALSNYEEMDKQSFAQQQKEYTANDMAASADKAWNAIVDSALLQAEYNALGIDVSEREFDAYLYGTDGFSVLPDIAQAFVDQQTGMFSPQMLQKRVDEMKTSTKAEEQLAWENTKRSLTIRRQQEKYFSLLNQGVYVSKLEAKDYYKGQKDVKSLSFIMKRLSDIPDTDINITDEALTAYYDEHKEDSKYKIRSASREVKFFDVNIVPSSTDSAQFNNLMTSLKNEFAAKSLSEDSAFVMKNSDLKYYINKVGYRVEGDENARQGFTYPKSMDSVIRNASVGTVVGPYNENGSEKIAKVIGRANQLLSVRHILISAQRQDTAGVERAQVTVDSLMAIVNNSNFESLVSKHSQDPGSNTTGGKYSDFISTEMVPEFSDFATNNPVGKIGYVQTDYGFHIIEVLDKKAGNVPMLAIVQKTLKPSQNTIDEKVSEVHELLYDIDDKITLAETVKEKIAVFDTLARNAGYFARKMNLNEKNIKVYGMNTPYAEDKIIELAFDDKNDAGTLYGSPIKDGSRYIIAMLSAKREEGTPRLIDVEDAMRNDLLKEKKGEKISSMMAGKSLSDLTKVVGLPIQNADVTFGSPQIPGGGYEPEVIGMIFSPILKDGTRTLPIVGKTGVYVIRVDKTTNAPTAANYDAEKQSMYNSAVSNIQGEAMAALKEKSNVIDNRRLYKIGVRQ